MTYNDDERRLLEAGKALDPEVDASRDRLLLAIASTSAVALAAASVKAAITLETKLALVTLGQVGLASLAKGTIVGGAVGIAIGASGDLWQRVSTESAAPAEHATEVAAVEAPADPPSLAPPEPVETLPPPAVSSPPPAIAVSPEARPHKGTPLAPPRDVPASPSPSRGLAALDAAKSALDRGDVAAAQEALAAYDRHRGDGALDPEAALLRLKTLAASGQGAAASELAEQWLTENPGTPYAAMLRGIIEQNGQRKTP